MRLVYLALAWAAGIALAAQAATRYPLAWLGLLAAAGAAAWGWRGSRPHRIGFLLLAVLFAGALRLALVPSSAPVAAYNSMGGLTLEGVVIAAPDIRDDGVRLRLAAETVTRAGTTQPTEGTVLVRAPSAARGVRYGDRILVTGQLVIPAQIDTFSYADFLAREGVFSVMENASVVTLSSELGNPIYAALLHLRDLARSRITAALPEPQAGLLTGILLGDQRSIAPEVADAFAASGVAHVVAISGFNMAILSAGVIRLFGRYQSRWWAIAIGVGVLAVYTVLVGANAAVMRAALMSSLLLIAPALKRKTYLPATLAFVVLLLTLVNPTVLWDVSFQLSFFATLGLTLFTEPLSRGMNTLLRRLFPRRVALPLGSFLAEPIVVTLAASITTLPLIALYFNRLSLVMLPVNLLVVPLQAALLLVGVVTLLIALVLPGVAQIGFWAVLVPLAWTIDVTRLFAGLTFAEIAFYTDARWTMILLGAVIGGAVLNATQPPLLMRWSALIRRRALVASFAAAAIALLVLIAALILSRPDGRLHVWWLDMGHSNAVLLRSPGGATILVDGGRFPSRLLTAVGDRLPLNQRSIDVLALTQPDEVDYGALVTLLDRYEVALTLTHGQPNQSDSYAQLYAALSESRIVEVTRGTTVELSDGLLIEVLHPAVRPDLGDSLDDHALTLRVSYGAVSFLLTGDLSADAQTALLDANVVPQVTVLQLPQHATARSLSADFLDAVQPSALVVQIDRANRRGDPDPDLLARLPDRPLLRTDRGGTVHFWTDGVLLWAMQG